MYYTDIDCFIMGVLFEVVFTNTTGATQPPAMPWVSVTLKDSVHDMKFLWVGKMTSCSWSFWSFRQDAFFLVLLLYGSKWSSSRRSKVGNQVQQFRVYIWLWVCQQSPLSNQPIWDATINVKVLSLQWAAFTVMTKGWCNQSIFLKLFFH